MRLKSRLPSICEQQERQESNLPAVPFSQHRRAISPMTDISRYDPNVWNGGMSGHEPQSEDLLKRTFHSALQHLISNQRLTISIGANSAVRHNPKKPAFKLRQSETIETPIRR